MDASLVFLHKIKQAFPNHPWVYLTFEKKVKAFLRGEIDRPTITAKITELFHGHSDLLLDFRNDYLPAICSSEQAMNALQVLDYQRHEIALCFVDAVEKTYLGQPHIFTEFSKICLESQLHPLAKLTKIRALFRDHPELIQTFQGFLPAGFAIEVDVFKVNPPTSDSQNDQGN